MSFLWKRKIFNTANGYLWSSLSDTSQWRHNERHGVSNHRRLDCLFNRLFMHRSKKLSKLRITGLCEGDSPVTGEFPTQMASNAENASISWRHHDPGDRTTLNRISRGCDTLQYLPVRNLTASWMKARDAKLTNPKIQYPYYILNTLFHKRKKT